MDSQVPARRKSLNGQRNRRFRAVACLLGLAVLIVAVFTIQTNMKAATQPQKRTLTNNFRRGLNKGFTKKVSADKPSLSLKDIKQNAASLDAARSIPEPQPNAIPANTPISKVTFAGSFITSSVLALADVDGDGTVESTETLITSDNPANEFITSFTFSKRQANTYYAAVMDAGGPTNAMSQILVVSDPEGDYIGSKTSQFSAGSGQLTGLSTIVTPQGEAIVAMRVFYGDDFDVITPDDNASVVIFPPGANGIPDGQNPIEINLNQLDPDLSFSFGGLGTDAKGNIYVNAVLRVRNGSDVTFGGAILAFSDTDGDGIPDSSSLFADGSEGSGDEDDLLPIAATSITTRTNAAGATEIIVFSGAGELFGGASQVGIYTDADGDLVADAGPRIFYTAPRQFRGVFIPLDPGQSSFFVSQFAFVNNEARYYFISASPQGNISNSGLVSVVATSSGVGGPPKNIFEARTSDGDLDFLSSIAGTGAVPDTVRPTIKLNTPNGGESVMGGTQLNITFTSSDDRGVTAHDLLLSTDGGATFTVPVATGLPGSAQSFQFLVPATIDTTNARIRVTAKDAGGNSASDDSDANFSIMRPNAADTQPPVVSISAPTAGASLNAGTMATVNFTSTDNIGVSTHNIDFSSDGVNFNTSLATGLAGTANSFTFRVPAINSQTAAIRVTALDPSGNMGTATVGQLVVISDTQAPTVSVTAPANKAKLKGNQMFNVTFTSSDDIGIASHEIQISADNGATFTSLATGVPGNVQSFMVTIPNMKIKKGVIRVIARDAAGNAGMGNSGVFKVKPTKN